MKIFSLKLYNYTLLAIIFYFLLAIFLKICLYSEGILNCFWAGTKDEASFSTKNHLGSRIGAFPATRNSWIFVAFK